MLQVQAEQMSNEELRIRLETLQVCVCMSVCLSVCVCIRVCVCLCVRVRDVFCVQDGFVQLRSILRREKQSRADNDRHPMEDM